MMSYKLMVLGALIDISLGIVGGMIGSYLYLNLF